MLKIEGEECWFEQIDENEECNSWYRRYAILRLSNEQLAREKEVHADFQRYVGTHWDCGQGLSREAKAVLPEASHHLFYDKHLAYCRIPRFENCAVVAWLEK